LLPFDQLVRVSGRAARLAHDLGVELSDQMDFGGAMRDLFTEEFERGASLDDTPAPASTPANPAEAAIRPSTPREPRNRLEPSREATGSGRPEALEGRNPQSAIPPPAAPAPATLDVLPSLGGEHQPVCLEPWKSLYILRRGVMPCCYGHGPIAPMEDYRTAWNSPLMQSIRGELLEGRFHDYCLRSAACPIVRKHEQAHALPPHQHWHLKAREWWARIDRRLGGVPNRIWRPLKGAIGRVRPIPHGSGAA
jgi:hypothetical protein